MKRRQQLIVNVTRDRGVHEILEKTISADKTVSAMFDRKYPSNRHELLEIIASADVLFSFAVPEDVLLKADKLKWLHFASAGVEKSLSRTLEAKRIKVTCSRGLHANTMAEYVMMQILAFSKNLRKAFDCQRMHLWKFEELLGGKFDLEGKTIAIIGLGSIGRRVARLAKAFDMRVIGTVNNPRKIRNVDRVYAASRIEECTRQADFIVLSAALTERTVHMVGRGQLETMKKNAFLVNIGRGRLVDEIALVESLKAGRIGGAALDVFESEPLFPNSPLWDIDSVSVTPHYSGMAENIWEKVARLFCENARRYKNGKRLLGIVNMELGY